jgi:hypothetical protein
MRRSHYVVGLVPVTDANYVQRRLKWDKPESDYSEQRERELAEMDDALREPLRGDHVVGRLLLQEPLANTARLLVERLHAAEQELQAREEELADLRAEGLTPAVAEVVEVLKEKLYPPDGVPPPMKNLLETIRRKVNAELKTSYKETTIKAALAHVRGGRSSRR